MTFGINNAQQIVPIVINEQLYKRIFMQVLNYMTGISLSEHVDLIARSKLYSKQNGKQFFAFTKANPKCKEASSLI